MIQRLEYATPPAPVPRGQTATNILRFFNTFGIFTGVILLNRSVFFTAQDKAIGAVLISWWVVYAVVELALLLITVCLKRELRRLAILGFAVLLISGARLWFVATHQR